jgi:hypothetical protein
LGAQSPEKVANPGHWLHPTVSQHVAIWISSPFFLQVERTNFNGGEANDRKPAIGVSLGM